MEVNASFLLLPLLLVDFSGTGRDLAFDAMFLLILFSSLLLHELGHAWGALVQGVPVRRIVLHCAGGFCERERSTTRHEQELVVAMGPIVSLTLWATAGLIAPFIADPEIAWVFWTISGLNGFIAVLNLLPVNPLDGGKLFALLMHRVFPMKRAMVISAAVGLGCAVLWVPLTLYGFAEFGFVFFFLPGVVVHWRALKGATRA
ncbi:MAG: site-2 protease family protein [Pseudomonadota bacterium]